MNKARAVIVLLSGVTLACWTLRCAVVCSDAGAKLGLRTVRLLKSCGNVTGACLTICVPI